MQVVKLDAAWQEERTGLRDRLERMQKVLSRHYCGVWQMAGRAGDSRAAEALAVTLGLDAPWICMMQQAWAAQVKTCPGRPAVYVPRPAGRQQTAGRRGMPGWGLAVLHVLLNGLAGRCIAGVVAWLPLIP